MTYTTEQDPTVSLAVSTQVDEDHRLVTEARAKEIYTRLGNMATGGGELQMVFEAWWRGSLRWARNRVSAAGDQRDIRLTIARKSTDGCEAAVTINQVDDTSLRAAINEIDRQIALHAPSGILGSFGMPIGILPAGGPKPPKRKLINTPLPYPETKIWSDATFNVMPEQRAKLAQTLMQGADTQQLLSAGYIEMSVHEEQSFGAKILAGPTSDNAVWQYANELPQGEGATRMARDESFVRYTQSQCSMTVRHPKGLGSGWAGLSGYDWSVIDSPLLAQRALDKCVTSLNPVAIEPGRYTVILEPQAVYDFASMFVSTLGRWRHEQLSHPDVWSEDIDPTIQLRMTKLGQIIMDERISITSDPMDPRLGSAPQLGAGPVTWVEKGRLVNMGYERKYALETLGDNLPKMGVHPFLISGGTTTMDQMIASMERGVLVTRFSSLSNVPDAGMSVLLTGVTRDGLWLIENGKISKSVKNMRFTDSPLFAFNQVEQLGIPVPIFNSDINPSIVPPIKSRDFAFTSTIDAI